MKEFKQLGAYGLVIQDGKILLIKKFGGPYHGKLDLPGGTIEFCERPEAALKRELMEEVGIEVVDCQLFDADSVAFEWKFKEDVLVKVHHTGIFFKVSNYNNEIKKKVKVDKVNDDSLGAEFFDIDKLSKKEYNRGVRWDNENLKLKGQQWKSAYLPIWLYSYQEEKKDKKVLHYVAVNARTKKTMGSVPIHMPKLLFISFLIEIAGLIAMLFTYSDDNNWPWLFLLSGVVYYLIIYGKYRNSGARHSHEKDTKTNISNLNKTDKLVRREKNLVILEWKELTIQELMAV